MVESRVDINKPYYGLMSDVALISSETNHVHANGFCPTHPTFSIVNTSRIIKIDLYDDDRYAELETRNSRYGICGDDYETIKFFCSSAECKEMREDAEIDFAFLH